MIFLSIVKKKFFFTLFLFASTFLISQVPAYIPYQAIARDASGLAKVNTAIQVEFRIFNTMVSSTPAYQENHAISTNDFGYFNLRIGAGNVQTGTFSNITWSTGDVSYEVWIDLGSGLTQLGGRAGFLSVPYALYAANSSPSPTLNINPPNTVTTNTPGIYNIQVATPSLTISNYALSISNGNTVALPGNYSAGNGIAINGTVISNSLPNQTVTISGNAVNGTYPAYSINNQSLSLSGNSLSLTGGGTVNLSAFATTLTQSTNVTVSGVSPDYTISAVTPTLTGLGNASVSGTYPLQTVSVPPQTLSISGNSLVLSGNGGSVTLPATPATTITQGTNILVSGSSPNYSVAAVTPTLTTSGGNVIISGAYPSQTLTVPSHTLSLSGNTLSLSNGGGTVDVSNSQWSTTGNSGINANNNFIGTTNAADLAVRTNGIERMRVTAGGDIGLGTSTPNAFFDVDYGTLKLGATSTPFSVILHGTAQKNNPTLLLGANQGTLSIPNALAGDMLILNLNDYTAATSILTLTNAWISAPGVATYNISCSLLATNIVTNFSYLIIRP